MKQIVCEVCGSNDLVKEDGCFICQYCGAKYSPEEAKRLIVEVNDKVEVKSQSITPLLLSVPSKTHAVQKLKKIGKNVKNTITW